jgi:radical SAM enzyme (TIGR01210 family)
MTVDVYDVWDDRAILALRPPKNPVDPWKPYACFVEDEPTRQGAVESVATLFLTNRECPFRCLMCDLWKNTTDQRVPAGAIPAQIEWALARLPPTRHIKLYNAGNFFDAQAIPPEDVSRIAELVGLHKTIIVECHPRLVGDRCQKFRDLLGGTLEIAMGLETVHPEVLPRLNKRMTTADFQQAAQFLTQHDIAVRAFVLLRPPYLNETEGVYWAKRSIEFAFDAGVECCAVIPTRIGNGVMELLARQSLFAPPRVESLEEVIEYGLGLGRGRVLADLWDIERFCGCRTCGPARARRLQAMNLTQHFAPPVVCQCRETT